MWERLTAVLTRIGAILGATPKEKKRAVARSDDPDIEFRPLNPPQAASVGMDTALICPVTRQTLRTGSLLYLCRNCNTAYSAEGWAFLRKTDRGRCCHCRHVGSVVPFYPRETPP